MPEHFTGCILATLMETEVGVSRNLALLAPTGAQFFKETGLTGTHEIYFSLH